MFNKLSVRIRKSNFDGNIAFGNVNIDDSFAFNIVVRRNPKAAVGENPWFISFPQHKAKDGSYRMMRFLLLKKPVRQFITQLKRNCFVLI